MSVVVVETFPTRVDRAARAAVHRYRAAFANHRGWRPRTSSTVAHRVGSPASDVLRSLCTGAGRVVVDVGDVVLSAEAASCAYDEVEHEHRIRAELHLAWSWPPLPMWLAIAEQGRSTSVLRLSLRSHHRLHYPVRYFEAAHRVLDRAAEAL